MRWVLCAVLLCTAGGAVAEQWPPIAGIRFEGNAVTRDAVLVRELAVAVGDPADPDRIEASRQAILDLGLFRDVRIEREPAPDGVVLTVWMREKMFILPVPRIDASSDQDFSAGATLRWYNVAGLNHSFNITGMRGRHPDDRLREREDRLHLWYDAPYLVGRDGLFTGIERLERMVPGPDGSHDETITQVQLLGYRDFRDGRPRRGWIGTAGVFWQQQATAGAFAPPPDGAATALVLRADYSDVRFHVYSETGRRLESRLEIAKRGWMSDYGYHRLEVEFVEHFAMPVPHQALSLHAAGGYMGGGPGRINAFALGGSSALRGYELDYLEGQRYLYLAAEYLQPVGWDWLRLLVVAETGATGGAVAGMHGGGGLHSSIGIGVRVRLTWFIDIEFEAGVAWPLRGGDGMRVFAGGG